MKCPNCDKPAGWKDNPHRPFCSERCKLIDFGAWVNEEYAVPSEEPAPPFEDSEYNPAAPGDEVTRRTPGS